MDRVQREDGGWTCDILSRQRTTLMGIAIIMILIFHYTEDCKIYKMHYSGFVEWYKTYIGSSSVDLFLFLSGMGLYYSMKKNSSLFAFYRRRLARVLLPYLLVAVPAWYWFDMVFSGEPALRMWQDLAFVTFFTEGVRWFWYIGAILAGYLIYPAVFVLADRCARAAAWFIFLSLCVFVTLYAVQMREQAPELFADINIVLLRIPPFLAGCFYGRASYEKRSGYWLWIPLAAVSVVFAGQVPDAESPVYVRYALAAANISVCACAAALFDRIPENALPVRVVGWFGTHSLELYLTHVAIRRIMNELGYLTCRWNYELVMLALAFGSAWLLQCATGWLDKRRHPAAVPDSAARA